MKEKKLTGYPSIDKPWLKYYTEEANTATLPNNSIYEYLWKSNEGHLGDIAINYYGTKWTYRRFFDEINKAVASFKKHGIQKGDIVSIMSVQTPETLACIYALNYLGAIANLVYITLSESELFGVIQNTNSKMLFILDTDPLKVEKIVESLDIPVVLLKISDSMPALMKTAMKIKQNRIKNNKIIFYRDFINETFSDVKDYCSGNGDDTAIIVYTSGTTGEPKGVMLSNNSINSVAFELQLTEKNYQYGETSFSVIPPFLGFGISMIHLSFCNGLTQIILLTADPDEIAKSVEKYKPNRVVYGPRLTDSFRKYVKCDLSFLKDFTGGGEEISIERETDINDFLLEHNSKTKYTTGYGMTETTSAICTQQNNIYRVGSVGVPLPLVNVKVVDVNTGNEMKCNEIGELCFTAPNLMNGYYKNRTATDDVLELDKNGVKWMHTGDLGLVDDDGFVFIKGRIKRIYTTFASDGNMYKLFPQRIEEFILKQPSVNHCAVLVKEDEIKAHIAIAYVELREHGDTKYELIKSINDSIHKELPDHLWPQSINIIESMPLTSSGKIDYRALEKQAEDL